MGISGSVGQGAKNNPADVKAVQKLLQGNGFPNLRDDGAFGPKTLDAIKSYQAKFLRQPDGVVDANGRTLRKLLAGNSQGSPSGTPQENRHLNSGRLTVSAGQVTFNAEGNDNPHSIYFSRHLHWPKGISGVTIGRGYDMGSRTQEAIFLDLTRSGVPTDQAELMSQGRKLTGSTAERFVKDHKNECGIISREAQARLFELIYPGYVSGAKAVYLSKTAKFPERTSWEALKSQ
ncbi:peptidoglycan-binding protein [Pantoea sp. BAV 3049]|uniref:peptidoglycan-binding protein n=1 Tax=Pantoea sp. BAV 3049 TaxID=2654188 RepID=UPI001E4CE2B8|nr:peptidoglycan-binding protein [Pantoea sp. BAV 3049]